MKISEDIFNDNSTRYLYQYSYNHMNRNAILKFMDNPASPSVIDILKFENISDFKEDIFEVTDAYYAELLIGFDSCNRANIFAYVLTTDNREIIIKTITLPKVEQILEQESITHLKNIAWSCRERYDSTGKKYDKNSRPEIIRMGKKRARR